MNFKPSFDKSKEMKLDIFIQKSPICHLKVPFSVTIDELRKNKKKSKTKETHVFNSQPAMTKNISWGQLSSFDWKHETFCLENDRRNGI